MADLFLSAVLPVLFEKLTSPELLKFATQEGVRSKLNKLKKTFELINVLLIDAEEKQLTNGAVKIWLDELQDLAYDAEDILDEYATEALRRKLKIQEHQASTSRARKLIPACCIGITPSALLSDLSMRSKIDDITSRLEDLYEKKYKLGLVELETARGRTTTPWQRPPTSSVPIEPAVFGRDDDKAKILKMVLSDEPDHANFGVISIVGTGGLGKTTLARLVFNATAVQDFNPRAWVCVSDDFDVMRISMAILESITGRTSDLKNLDAVQNKLKEKVAGKKFLLVLDDVWSEDYSKWEILRSPFMVAAPRSKIIVTTRHERVALTMGRPTECHKLQLLSNDDCWSLFEKHAFGNGAADADASKLIREKVIEKCKGLPLIAKTLGGLLRAERREKWFDILNSKLWELANESEIPTALQISYHHLPSHLKRCFTYCAILPKDYEFDAKELVFLWMAEGLIQESSENKQMEDFGGEYFLELLSRSMFQISSINNSKYIMHDLINDLAQRFSGNVCFKMEDDLKNSSSIVEKARYAAYICHEYNDKRKFRIFNNALHLRTYLSVPQVNDWVETCYISNIVVSDLFSRFKKLRVLSLQKHYIVELPDSIRNLRLLRYLNLSDSKIRSLPKATNSMCNLQTLLLRDCYKLSNLPMMEGLINLRHLDILGAISIEEMPLGVKKWRCLQTLSNFVVSKDSGANLIDLEDLKSLGGELYISRLNNMTNFQDTKKVILSDKKDLKVLSLEWESRFDESQTQEVESKDAKILDILQPHKNLEKLTIRCFRGTNFSSWVGGSSFSESKITILELIDCKNCISLPSLGLLSSLKNLTIRGMKGIKGIGFEFYGDGRPKPFQSLETLRFKDLEEWESWNPIKENDSFLNLQELSIVNCPKLSKRLPNNLPLLKKLMIHECRQLVVSLSNFPRLCEVELDQCKKIVHDNSTFSESLESLILLNISDVGDWSGQEFKKVNSLKVEGCKELIESWQNEIFLKKPHQGVHSLISLKSLQLDNCDTLTTTLLEGIKQANTCLEDLTVQRCDSLNFIFRGQPPQSLKKLRIAKCEKFECLLDGDEVTCTSLCPAMTYFLQKLPFPTILLPNQKVNTSTCHLEDLYIDGCPSLTCLPSTDALTSLSVSNCSNLTRMDKFSATLTGLHIAKCSNLITIDQLPATLTTLSISSCWRLTTLSLTGHLPVALKRLQILDCSELTTLSPKGRLPETLETLRIAGCGKLESIVDKFHNNSSLYEINIGYCDELKSLPEGLHTLTNLCSIGIIFCKGFTSFPEGGFPCSNLRVFLWGCLKVEALPSGIHTLSSLQIHSCPNMSLSEKDLPTKLTTLSINEHKQYKVLMDRGLHNFISLEHLRIYGWWLEECIQEEKNMTIALPSTLTELWIEGFPKLKNLSFKEFQDLSSLKCLSISNCPELTSLPSLPFSLLELYILGCPLLKEACKRNKGKEWSKIADIPRVDIDDKFIYDLEEEA